MTGLQRLAEFMSQPYAFPTAAMALFLLELILTLVAPNFRRLFLPRYGRRHRIMGAVYIAVLIVGLTDIAARVSSVAREHGCGEGGRGRAARDGDRAPRRHRTRFDGPRSCALQMHSAAAEMLSGFLTAQQLVRGLL